MESRAVKLEDVRFVCHQLMSMDSLTNYTVFSIQNEGILKDESRMEYRARKYLHP